ncbi:hypothetical protein NP233_g5097 [Leucocoprinus birnbaumii]|uniref:60S ribosomal protein L39 n=1 Tax=Leucocoprinus birnbaumii TaxID=56174 RepID=A0AAD5VTJ2_9AGAR|nr:hypothetical protein NP233_g5097 [Leucocoprinus birnbaumii]
MPSQKTFRIKQKLAKAGRQNRPIPQWFRLKTDTKIQVNHPVCLCFRLLQCHFVAPFMGIDLTRVILLSFIDGSDILSISPTPTFPEPLVMERYSPFHHASPNIADRQTVLEEGSVALCPSTSHEDMSSASPNNATGGNSRLILAPPVAADSAPRISGSIIYNSQITGNFPGANNLMIVNSTFVEGSAQIAEAKVMEQLRGHAMPDVGLKSRAREPLPRCHPDTRTTLRNKVADCFQLKERRERLLWVDGPAGQPCSSPLIPNKTIAEQVIPTIAYQIARWNRPYREYLVEKLSLDPLLFENSIDEQFRVFITTPITEKGVLGVGKDFFIVLDGLEQCGWNHTKRSVSRSNAQIRLLSLITQFITDFPSAPIIWVVSSRSEEHLKTAFKNIGVKYWHLHVPIDDEEAQKDVQIYLRAGFSEIYRSFESRFSDSNWPIERKFKKVVRATSGLFVFGRDILEFTGDAEVQNPVSQFEIVYSVIDGVLPADAESHPFGGLNAFYKQIVTPVHHVSLANMQRLLGHLLLRERFFADLSLFGYSLYALSNVLGLAQDAVYTALSHLHSVLDIPPPALAHIENIRFLHSSFPDYLRDARYPEDPVINFPSVNAFIWKRYTGIINQPRKPRLRMELEQMLVYEAQFHWAHYFIRDCPCVNPPTSGPLGVISLNDQERLDILESVKFNHLISGYFDEDEDHFGFFFSYFLALWQSYPEELERRKTSLHSGIEKTQFILRQLYIHHQAPESKETRRLKPSFAKSTSKRFGLKIDIEKKRGELTLCTMKANVQRKQTPSDLSDPHSPYVPAQDESATLSSSSSDSLGRGHKHDYPPAKRRKTVKARQPENNILPRNVVEEDEWSFTRVAERKITPSSEMASSSKTMKKGAIVLSLPLHPCLQKPKMIEDLSLGNLQQPKSAELLAFPQDNTTSSIVSPLETTHMERSSPAEPSKPTTADSTVRITHSVIRNSRISGNFPGANNLVFQNSVFVAGMSPLAEERVMDQLRGHAILDAGLTSSERGDPPPRCHRETRISLLNNIRECFLMKQNRRLLWLFGPAGVGKSAIMQTIAENEHQLMRAAALFLPLYSAQRGRATRILPTIAYQIAQWNPLYRKYLVEQRFALNRFLESGISEQFRAFITTPIIDKGVFDGYKESFIALDALEQCGSNEVDKSVSREDVQILILKLIAQFIQKYPAAPIIWVVSSRSEEHLKLAFSEIKVEHWPVHVPIDDDEARKDVQIYLRAGFRGIYKRYQSRFRDSNWPTERKFRTVAHAASGLFVFGRDVLQFIGDRKIRNPVLQLEVVLSMIERSSTSQENHPFVGLEAFYKQIIIQLSRELPAHVDMQRLLGHLLLRERFFADLPLFGYSLYAVSNILGLTQDAVYTALSHLHSVLDIPPPEIAHMRNIQFLHSSFSEYLKGDQLSTDHSIIDFSSVNTYIWNRYTQIINENLPLEETSVFESGLLFEARLHWTHFLVPNCPCISVPSSEMLGSVSLSDRERLDALETVKFNKLIAGYFTKPSDHFGPFFAFIRALWKASPEELERRHLVEEVSLGSFSMESIDTKDRNQALYIEAAMGSRSSISEPVQSWRTHELGMDQLIDVARSLQEDKPDTPVLICGKVPDRGALIMDEQNERCPVQIYVPLL